MEEILWSIMMYLEYDDIKAIKKIKETKHISNQNFWKEKCKVEKVVIKKEEGESKWKEGYKENYDREKGELDIWHVIQGGYKREMKKRLEKNRNYADENLLRSAISMKKMNIVDVILRNIDIEKIESNYLETVLMILMEHQIIEISKKIIEYIEYKKDKNYNPFLYYAAKTGCIELFNLVKEKFYNVDNYIYSIEIAIEHNKYKMVKYIIEKCYYPTIENINNYLYTCGKFGFVKISEYLIELGGDINILYESSIEHNQLSTLKLVQKMGIVIYSEKLHNNDLRIINHFNSRGYQIPYDSAILSISSNNIFIYYSYIDHISSDTLLYLGFKTKNLNYIEKALQNNANNLSKIILNFLDVSYLNIFSHLFNNLSIHIDNVFPSIIHYIVSTNSSIDFNIISFLLNNNPSNISHYLYYICSTYRISSIITFLLADADPFVLLSYCIELNILPNNYLFSTFIQKGINPTYLIYLIIISFDIKYRYISKFSHYNIDINLLFKACSSSINVSPRILNYIKSNTYK